VGGNSRHSEENIVELPVIEAVHLPDLPDAVGVFGSQQHPTGTGSDDTLIVLMVFLYDIYQ
jgi:hypothetical protein